MIARLFSLLVLLAGAANAQAQNMPGSGTQVVPGTGTIAVPLPKPSARDLEIQRRQEEYARKADEEEKAREIEAFRNSPQRAPMCAGYENFLRDAAAGKFRDQPAADLKQAVDATRKYRDQLCR